MNILLTSVGRRNYLVSYFQEALEGRGRVLVTDADPCAAALRAADEAFVTPRFDDPSYFDIIDELCQRHHIDLIISLNDLELPHLARHKEELKQIGVTALVSEPEIVDACLDKWETFRLLSNAGVDTPLTFNTLDDALEALQAGKLTFPVMVKPRWGTGSIGLETAHTYEELAWAYKLLSRKLDHTILANISRTVPGRAVLIQERLSGSEYGLDVVNNLDGQYVTTLAKRKLSMRAGETDKAVTVHKPELEALGEKLGCLVQHVAIMDCDVLVTDKNCIAVLELNPRFGGGYPFSHIAGANIPAAILAWLEGRDASQEWLSVRPGIAAAKYDTLIPVHSWC